MMAMQTSLNHKEDRINALKKEIRDLQAQHTTAMSEIAVMRTKLETAVNKKSGRRPDRP